MHRVRRLMYNARLCLRRVLGPAEKARVAEGQSSLHPLRTEDLVPACLLAEQPLGLLGTTGPVSSVFTAGAQRVSEELELSPSWDLDAMRAEEDHVSHVVDWWPEELMPVGYHVTAPMLRGELAPVGFDSHYAYDAEDGSIHYVHSALRNASLLGEYLGAGGLCRQEPFFLIAWRER